MAQCWCKLPETERRTEPAGGPGANIWPAGKASAHGPFSWMKSQLVSLPPRKSGRLSAGTHSRSLGVKSLGPPRMLVLSRVRLSMRGLMKPQIVLARVRVRVRVRVLVRLG